MAIRISDKNRREMSPERDFGNVVPVRKRYCILSSPRSGSTLLGRVLYETGMAGDPQEYFNPPLLEIERQRSGNAQLGWTGFIKIMESRRTSPNGVFGMKLHFSQMLNAFKSRQVTQPMINMLKVFNHLVWIRRKDRLGQGISQAVGLRTQVWSSEDQKDIDISASDISSYDCLRALTTVTRDDYGWEQVLKATGLSAHVVWYEDLIEDYHGEITKVLSYIGIEDRVSEIPEPPLKRQATRLNEDLRGNVLDYLGVTDKYHDE